MSAFTLRSPFSADQLDDLDELATETSQVIAKLEWALDELGRAAESMESEPHQVQARRAARAAHDAICGAGYEASLVADLVDGLNRSFG